MADSARRRAKFQKRFHKAPEFVKRLNAFEEAQAGDTVTFECQWKGLPKPTTKWYRDDEEVTAENERVTIESLENGVEQLTVSKVRKKDEGAYKCKAENQEGVASTTGYLTVKGDYTDKPLSAQPRKNPDHAVSAPPHLRTIVEQKSMEEREEEEYSSLPPSPLHDFIDAQLSLQRRLTPKVPDSSTEPSTKSPNKVKERPISAPVISDIVLPDLEKDGYDSGSDTSVESQDFDRVRCMDDDLFIREDTPEQEDEPRSLSAPPDVDDSVPVQGRAPSSNQAFSPLTTEATATFQTQASVPFRAQAVATETGAPFTTTVNIPFTTQSSAPVIIKANAPVTAKASTPFTTQASGPFIAQTSAPATIMVSAPVTAKSSTPFTTKESGPLTTQTRSPVTIKANAPVTAKASTPFTTQASGPFITQTSTPVPIKVNKPITAKVSVPFTKVVSVPSTIQASAPFTTQASTPSTREASAPFTSELNVLLLPVPASARTGRESPCGDDVFLPTTTRENGVGSEHFGEDMEYAHVPYKTVECKIKQIRKDLVLGAPCPTNGAPKMLRAEPGERGSEVQYDTMVAETMQPLLATTSHVTPAIDQSASRMPGHVKKRAQQANYGFMASMNQALGTMGEQLGLVADEQGHADLEFPWLFVFALTSVASFIASATGVSPLTYVLVIMFVSVISFRLFFQHIYT